jgi:hypothetical protein
MGITGSPRTRSFAEDGSGIALRPGPCRERIYKTTEDQLARHSTHFVLVVITQHPRLDDLTPPLLLLSRLPDTPGRIELHDLPFPPLELVPVFAQSTIILFLPSTCTLDAGL